MILDDKKYVSGEDIVQKLGISREAISKNIKALKDNYQITLSSNLRVDYLEEKLDLVKIDDLAKAFKNVNYFFTL
ncbi:HTH domain-containing protein [Francisella persica]|uniref:HTH domain-containing protein n=1 Tax=Francisella persica TaxID=954 RepID=UPI002ADDD95B|nr:HTH domain-containing protein [Francisella persica]